MQIPKYTYQRVHRKNFYNRGFCLKTLCSEATASFACLRCHLLHLNPKRWIPKEPAESWKYVGICDYKCFVQNSFAYLLRAHIHNISAVRIFLGAPGPVLHWIVQPCAGFASFKRTIYYVGELPVSSASYRQG